MTISTFIFVHDQNIAIDCEKKGTFIGLPDVTYVLLGDANYSLMSANYISAQNLAFNIEQYPKFCAFTGWYVLWKNNLIKTDYVHLFEYDIEIRGKFHTIIQDLVNYQHDFIGYVTMSMDHYYINTPKYLGNIIPSIKKQYSIDITEIISNYRKRNVNPQWSSTSNCTMSYKTFNQYMIWFEKLLDDIKTDPHAGHIHERSLSFFYLIFNKSFYLTKDLIKHKYLNSHKTY